MRNNHCCDTENQLKYFSLCSCNSVDSWQLVILYHSIEFTVFETTESCYFGRWWFLPSNSKPFIRVCWMLILWCIKWSNSMISPNRIKLISFVTFHCYFFSQKLLLLLFSHLLLTNSVNLFISFISLWILIVTNKTLIDKILTKQQEITFIRLKLNSSKEDLKIKSCKQFHSSKTNSLTIVANTH